MSKIFSPFKIISALILLSCTVHAHSKQHYHVDIEIKKEWVRIANKTQNSAVFLEIYSHQGDELLSAECDIAEKVELHNHFHKTIDGKDVMEMRPVDKIELPKEKWVSLKQGGLHVMLIGLKKDIVKGDMVKLTLKFKNSAPLQVLASAKKKPCKCHEKSS